MGSVWAAANLVLLPINFAFGAMYRQTKNSEWITVQIVAWLCQMVCMAMTLIS